MYIQMECKPNNGNTYTIIEYDDKIKNNWFDVLCNNIYYAGPFHTKEEANQHINKSRSRDLYRTCTVLNEDEFNKLPDKKNTFKINNPSE